MRNVILDVDTGSDDAVAIMMAALAPEIDLLGCTSVWGNNDVDVSADNTLRVLNAIGSQVSVHQGLGRPFAPDPFGSHLNSGFSHGGRDPLPIPATDRVASARSAVEWIVETLREAVDPVTLVPVGPLTNIAAALTVAPDIAEAIDEVVIMGGGHAVANASASAEANIWHDPVAASVVLHAGLSRIVLVPLDATHDAYVTGDEAAQLRRVGLPATELAAQMIELRVDGAYVDITPDHDSRPAVPLNDAVCVAYLLDPSILDLQHCHLDVERTSALTWGRTVADLRRGSLAQTPKNAYLALHTDRTRFLEVLERSLRGLDVASSAEAFHA